MTLDEKIGQLVIGGLDGLGVNANSIKNHWKYNIKAYFQWFFILINIYQKLKL